MSGLGKSTNAPILAKKITVMFSMRMIVIVFASGCFGTSADHSKAT
jgi:hypothetical protein